MTTDRTLTPETKAVRPVTHHKDRAEREAERAVDDVTRCCTVSSCSLNAPELGHGGGVHAVERA